MTSGKIKTAALVATLLLFAGCGTAGQISGRFVGRDGVGIPNATVVCWQRGKVMELPARVAETKTDQNGRFEILANSTVHSTSARTSDTLDKIRHGTVTLRSSSHEVLIKEEPNPDRH
jgi:hypothetical protein